MILLPRTYTYTCWCKFCKHTNSDNGTLCGNRYIVMGAFRKLRIKTFREGSWLSPGGQIATSVRTPELFVYKKTFFESFEKVKIIFSLHSFLSAWCPLREYSHVSEIENTLRYGLALHPCSIKQQSSKQITYYSDFCVCDFLFLFVFFFRSERNLKSGSLRGGF